MCIASSDSPAINAATIVGAAEPAPKAKSRLANLVVYSEVKTNQQS